MLKTIFLYFMFFQILLSISLLPVPVHYTGYAGISVRLGMLLSDILFFLIIAGYLEVKK